MARIHFKSQGQGPVILLIHGFPLTHEIWNEVTVDLISQYRVVAIDLPGFGNSELTSPAFTIDQIATQIISFLKSENIASCCVAGHSLGGYVALAMVHQRPDLFTHLILFHSTPFADTDEKRQNRNKVLEFIKENGVTNFTRNFVAPLFADQSNPAIDEIKKLALSSSEIAVTGYTAAMRDRADRTAVLRDFHKPSLIIAGEKDQVIPLSSLDKLKGLSSNLKVKILQGAGHMGMVEKPAESAKFILEFISQSNRP